MKLIESIVNKITRSNIVALFPQWSPTTTYETEVGIPNENATYKSVAVYENYQYRSTLEGNLNNNPIETLGTKWIEWVVANIYAMLDFKKDTQSTWENDGIAEFIKEGADTLIVGNVKAGTVVVNILSPKHGVLDGLVLTLTGTNTYNLTKGSWYAQNVYTKQNVNWVFDNTRLTANRDNYIYPEYTNTRGNTDGASVIEIVGKKAYIVSNATGAFTILDITNVTSMVEIGTFTSLNLIGSKNIAIDGTEAYVVSGTSVVVIDISNESELKELSIFTSANIDGASGIAINSTVAYVVSSISDSITSIDISTPAALEELHSITSANLNGATDIVINGTEAYVVAGQAGSITSIDITAPTALSELDSYSSVRMLGNTISIAIFSSFAFVVAGQTGFITSISITTPTALSELDSYSSIRMLGDTLSIAISGTVAFVASDQTGAITSINLATPTALHSFDSIFNENLKGAHSIAISGTEAYVAASDSDLITAIDISNPSSLVETSHFPETSVKVISVPVGYDQPTTPDGDIAIWMITTDSTNLFVSQTDLRVTETDEILDGYTQIKTFYNSGAGAAIFTLPNIGEIVRVEFLEANSAGSSCGTMLAGIAQDLGDTLAGVAFGRKRDGLGWEETVSFETFIEKEDMTQTANLAKQAYDKEVAFVIDPSVDSVHQNMLISGKIESTSYGIDNFTKQHLNFNIIGEELISEQPTGLDTIPFFELGVDPLQITKGSGDATHTRTTVTTYRDKDYLTLKEADIDEVVYESAGMRGSCASTNECPTDSSLFGVAGTGAVSDTTTAVDDTSTSATVEVGVGGAVANGNYNSGCRLQKTVQGISLDGLSPVTDAVFIKAITAISTTYIFFRDETNTIQLRLTLAADANGIITITAFATVGSPTDVKYGIEAWTNGWYRVYGTFTSGIAFTSRRIVVNAGAAEGDTIAVDFWNIAEKAFMTAYTPTVSAPVTTTGDIISYDTASNIPDLTADWSMKWTGTIYFDSNSGAINEVVYNFTDVSNRFRLYQREDYLALAINSGGVSVNIGVNISSLIPGLEIAVEIKCINGIVTMYIDGIEKDSDDFSTVLDVPLDATTYIASTGASTPNTNSVIYTKLHAWEQL